MRPLLNGSRTRLVPLERHHLPHRVKFINDAEVQATLNFDYPTSLARTEAWFQKNVLSNDRIDFAIEVGEDGIIIGFCGLININRISRKSELYIFIGNKKFWGEGYGRDGYRLITNYGFLEMGMEKIYLHQLTTNERAQSATRYLGWTVEGLLRKDIYSHGKLRDQQILSILKEEWERNTLYDNI
jgi:RimJ/RimL family protein N-acetyltransferase